MGPEQRLANSSKTGGQGGTKIGLAKRGLLFYCPNKRIISRP